MFAAATDGNHGKGVAWVANELGHLAQLIRSRADDIYKRNEKNIKLLTRQTIFTKEMIFK